MANKNLNIQYDNKGNLNTNDDELNQIIRAVETETGSKLGMVTQAISFDDDPEAKVYLLLLKYWGETEYEDSIKDWSISTGRQSTYNRLKELIKNELIDPNESFIISGNVDDKDHNLELNSKPITVFRFMKVMFENRKILDDDFFDIDEYQKSESGDKTIFEI